MVHEMRLMRPFNHKTGKKMFGKITVRIEDDAHDSTGANGLFCCFPLVSKSVYPRGWLAACMWSNITLWRQITVNYQTLLPVRGIAFRLVNVIWRHLETALRSNRKTCWIYSRCCCLSLDSKVTGSVATLSARHGPTRPGGHEWSVQYVMWCDGCQNHHCNTSSVSKVPSVKTLSYFTLIHPVEDTFSR